MNLSANQYNGREILSIMQAMSRAQVSRRTIYNWLLHGRLEFVRTAGGAVRIFADTLFRDQKGGAYDEQRTS